MTRAEQWRPIPGYGGWYELSRHGEIRSWCVTGPRKKRRDEPLILRPFMALHKRTPELQITLMRKTYSVKILMRDIWMAGPKPGMRVTFIDGDRTNCALHNLRYSPVEEVRTNPQNRCPIAKCKPWGTVIAYYRSMAEAAEKNHISRSGMQTRINNETLADGVVFRRASELEGK